MIENMYMSNPHICHDKFIDQLVNMTHNFITESPYTCISTSKSSSRISDISIVHEFQQPLPKPQSVSSSVVRSSLFTSKSFQSNSPSSSSLQSLPVNQIFLFSQI